MQYWACMKPNTDCSSLVWFIAERGQGSLLELGQRGGRLEQLILDQLDLLATDLCHKVQHHKQQQRKVHTKVGEEDEVLGVAADGGQQHWENGTSKATREQEHRSNQVGHVGLMLQEGVCGGVTRREALKIKKRVLIQNF